MAPESSPTKGPRKVVRLGKYEVVAHIATGGMGAVYKALDTENNREVALKVLPPEMAAKPAMLERFRREAKHAAKLQHDNIVALYEFDEINGNYFIAMEFVNGVDLHEYVKQKGTVDPEESRLIVLQACRALRHAFDQDIVHRDIKPSNFLITRKNGRPLVKLTDMGLSRETNADDFRVTRAGTTVGTLDYMAPEQARDSSAADIRSDLYSLGSTWYHLLTGKAPFPEGGLAERLYKIMNEDPPDIRDLNPEVSSETWYILQKLLAKDPDDRYQTPAELIDDLLALEGKATAPPDSDEDLEVTRPARKKSRKKGKKRPDDTDPEAKAPTTQARTRRGSSISLILMVGSGLILVLCGLILTVVLINRERRKPPVYEELQARSASVILPAPPPPIGPPGSNEQPDKEKENGPDQSKNSPPLAQAPQPDRLPALYSPSTQVDFAALRKRVEKPWEKAAPANGAFLARIRRAPGGSGYATLAAACAAAPAKTAIVLEIHDNGPLYETSLALSGRDVTLKAGPGYRPLLVWDVPRSLEKRKRAEQGAKGEPSRNPTGAQQPLSFLSIDKGSLTLQGIDLACRWPEASGEIGTLIELRNSDLNASSSTFSVAGKHPKGLTLVRMHDRRPTPGRCRFDRCHVRGGMLTALDLQGGLEVLVNSCLFTGGDQPLFKVGTDSKQGTQLSLVRSTLVCGNSLLEVRPLSSSDKNPALRCLAWDTLCSRSGVTLDDAMVLLRDGVDPQKMSWEAYNSLYAGWQNLLAGTKTISSTALSEWQRHWKRIEGDAAITFPWPDQMLNEPADLPASTYTPAKNLTFAASVDPASALGCDLAHLPRGHDGWLATTQDPILLMPEPPTDPGAPEIPTSSDGLYHGEKLDLKDRDLGHHLLQIQKTKKFAPHVVLHLSGQGEQATTPIRLKGIHLTLYFEPPTKDEPPLILRMSGAGEVAEPQALIDLEEGSLEVIGGHLKVSDLPGPRVPWVIKVQKGNVRLYRTRVEGPQQAIPDLYRGLISVTGSGSAQADQVFHCAANESILVSGKTGIELSHIGARLFLRQTLLVAGGEGVRLNPLGCQGQVNMQCLLENVTVAAQKAVVGLADVADAPVPSEPAVLITRNCAFLNPFVGKPTPPAGLLVYEGDALQRGLLVCLGERDSFDRRLFFAAAPAVKIPDKPEGYTGWQAVWGQAGMRDPRPELTTLPRSFDPRRWPLDRLILPADRGANLEALGIKKSR